MHIVKSVIAALTGIALLAPSANAACNQGAYVSDGGDYVVVVPLPDTPAAGQRYLFRDGRRGSTADENAPLTCVADASTIKKSDGTEERWKQLPLTATDTQFSSVETELAGRLIEPRSAAARRTSARRHGARVGTNVCTEFVRTHIRWPRKASRYSSTTSAERASPVASTRRTSSCSPRMRPPPSPMRRP